MDGVDGASTVFGLVVNFGSKIEFTVHFVCSGRWFSAAGQPLVVQSLLKLLVLDNQRRPVYSHLIVAVTIMGQHRQLLLLVSHSQRGPTGPCTRMVLLVLGMVVQWAGRGIRVGAIGDCWVEVGAIHSSRHSTIIEGHLLVGVVLVEWIVSSGGRVDVRDHVSSVVFIGGGQLISKGHALRLLLK